MPPHVGWEGERRGRTSYPRVRRPAFFVVRLRVVFFGTFWPAARASERPMAIACLRLLTCRPERPLFNVLVLRFFIARSTVLDAFFEYFRAMIALLWRGTNQRGQRWFLPEASSLRLQIHLRIL